MRPLLNDPVRLVRLDAAWALSDELQPASAQATELAVYLAAAADQPLGQLRIGQHLANRGDTPAAIKALQKAVSWDSRSAPILETLGLIYQQAGQTDAAANAFVRAANLTPNDPEPIFNAALLFAEAGQSFYAQSQQAESGASTPGADSGDAGSAGQPGEPGAPEEVVEADYEIVDEEKK